MSGAMSRILLLILSVFAISIGASQIGRAAEADIICVQNELNSLGFDAGAPNGNLGPQTLKAAQAYIDDMTSKHPGWAMPLVTAELAAFWCKKVAEAHPQVAKHAQPAGKVSPKPVKAAKTASNEAKEVPVMALATRWIKTCNGEGARRLCTLQRRAVGAGGPDKAVFAFTGGPDGKSPYAMATVPADTLVLFDMTWQVDQQAPLAVTFSFCNETSCFADATSLPTAALKRGNTLTLTRKNLKNEDVSVKVDLSGFTKTFDAPGEQ